jgi:hypothetical protein
LRAAIGIAFILYLCALVAHYVGEITGFIPDPPTSISCIDIQKRKVRILSSTHAF